MTVKEILPITDHQDQAIARLRQLYKDAIPKLSVSWSGGLVSGWDATIHALTAPTQTLEDIMNEMLTERGIEVAVGLNLDRIGQIVGTDRQGDLDPEFKVRIVGQIAANNSDATARDLLAIATILLGSDLQELDFKEQFPAKGTLDYLVELEYVITAANKTLEVEADFGVSGVIEINLTEGTYFPHQLDTLFQDAFLAALGQSIIVSWSAATRKFTFHLDDVAVLANPAILWGTAGPLYGFTDGTDISSTTTGSAITAPEYDTDALEAALNSAKAAGVDIFIELVAVGNYFGFSNDPEAQGFASLDGGVLIGGGNYATLIT